MIFVALGMLFGGKGLKPLPLDELKKLADEELMIRYGKGDAKSFEILLTRHERGIYNFIYRSTGSAERAEELAQDTFMRVIRTANKYQKKAKFTTWLYTIARNICIDEGRKQSRRHTVSLDASVGDSDEEGRSYVDNVMDTQAESGSGRMVRDEFLARLKEGLAELPEEQREVFILRHYDGLKFREIAEMAGVSENTIKSRMRYALDVLRGYVADFQGHSFDEEDFAEMADRDAKKQV